MPRKKQVKKGQNSGKKPALPPAVVKLPPDADAARDEGPRLLPLEPSRKAREDARLQRYLDLADTLLKPKQNK